MQRGYIKVWRKIIDAGWLKNHKLCSFWLWCLIKASHKEYDLIVGCQTVHLMPGEFVFGLKAASKELSMGIQSIRTLLDFLKNTQNLTIKSTNKFSVITIVNWNTYQGDDLISNKQSNKRLTNNQQTTNNKQTHKEHENIKNIYIPLFVENIKLTEEEYSKLKLQHGQSIADQAIKYLSEYKIEKGYKTKSDYLTIKRWVIDAVNKKGGDNGKFNSSYRGDNQRRLKPENEATLDRIAREAREHEIRKTTLCETK